MSLETIKTLVDIGNGILQFFGVILVAATAILIWLMSAVPKARITAIFWYPETSRGDTPFPVSVEIHFYNPAVGSVVVSEIEVNRLIFEQGGRKLCHLSPFAFLGPLTLTDKQRTFSARTTSFLHGFLLKGHAELITHIGFHFDLTNYFRPSEGDLTIKLEVLYTGHDPFHKFLRLLGLIGDGPKGKQYVYTKHLAHDEAEGLAARQTTVFLARGLPGQDDLRFVCVQDSVATKT